MSCGCERKGEIERVGRVHERPERGRVREGEGGVISNSQSSQICVLFCVRLRVMICDGRSRLFKK